MPRIIRYEIKKILSLPVLILLAGAVCLLAFMPLSRCREFSMINGLQPREYRAVSMEYAGPLDEALAERAIVDWRHLPQQTYYEYGTRDETLARRNILNQLAKEYSALPQPEVSKTASPDAAQRIAELQKSIVYPPLVHGYYEGWADYFEALNTESAYLCGILIIFGIATLFSGETLAAMLGLTRTMKHGRVALATAKLIAAELYGGLCGMLCALLPLLAGGMLFGLDGYQLPAQYAAKTALPLTMAGYAGLRIALYLLGGLGMAAVMALLSASMPSITAPAIAGLAVFLAPYLYGMLPSTSKILDSVMNYLPLRLLLPEPLMGLQPVILWQSALYQIPWLGIVWAVIIPLLCYGGAAFYLRVHFEEPILQE